MSAHVHITCDGCGTVLVSDANTTQDARRLISADGGTHAFGKDYCADCVSKKAPPEFPIRRAASDAERIDAMFATLVEDATGT